MQINYKKLIDKALIKGVVVPILHQIASSNGYAINEILLTFLTSSCTMSDKLRALFPNKITVSLENYEKLTVNEGDFTITTYLPTGLESIIVPFSSVTQYIDKTNQFALEFETIIVTQEDSKVVKIDFN